MCVYVYVHTCCHSGSLVSNLGPTLATLWTEAHQALLSLGFSRQEYWSGLPFPPLGNLSNPGIGPGSSALQTDSLPAEPQGKPLYIYMHHTYTYIFILAKAIMYIYGILNHPQQSL